jgi:hypothetical protein
MKTLWAEAVEDLIALVEAVKVGALTRKRLAIPNRRAGSAFLIQNGKLVEKYSANVW